MILPSLILVSRAGRRENETGMDSLDCCLDPNHWRNYPHQVQYCYNSRGFRDQEWPQDLHSSIWCFGDSFTVGVGVPYSHIWPQVLTQRTGCRTINVSMDGASNNWIARKIQEMSQHVQPATVIVHWSFLHRRELNSSDAKLLQVANQNWHRLYNAIKDSTWPLSEKISDFDSLPQHIQDEILQNHCDDPNDRWLIENRHNHLLLLSDEARRLYHSQDLEFNTQNTINCINHVQQCLPNTQIIHSFIPGFGLRDEMSVVCKHISSQQWSMVKPFDKLDLARDGYHYDILTAEKFSDQLIKLI